MFTNDFTAADFLALAVVMQALIWFAAVQL